MSDKLPTGARSVDQQISVTDRYCLYCGYDLRATIDARCPECGHAFDATDRSTFLSSSHDASAARWAINSVRHSETVNRLRWFSIAAMLWGASYLPGGFFVLFSGIAMAGLAFPLTAVGNVTRYFILRKYRIHRDTLRFPSRLPWVGLLLTIILVFYGVPGRVMFMLHTPWLNKYADQIYAKEPFIGQSIRTPRFIGLLLIINVRNSPNGVTLQAGPGIRLRYATDANTGVEIWNFESPYFDWNPITQYQALRSFY